MDFKIERKLGFILLFLYLSLANIKHEVTGQGLVRVRREQEAGEETIVSSTEPSLCTSQYNPRHCIWVSLSEGLHHGIAKQIDPKLKEAEVCQPEVQRPFNNTEYVCNIVTGNLNETIKLTAYSFKIFHIWKTPVFEIDGGSLQINDVNDNATVKVNASCFDSAGNSAEHFSWFFNSQNIYGRSKKKTTKLYGFVSIDGDNLYNGHLYCSSLNMSYGTDDINNNIYVSYIGESVITSNEIHQPQASDFNKSEKTRLSQILLIAIMIRIFYVI